MVTLAFLFLGNLSWTVAGKLLILTESWIDDSQSKEQVEKVKSLFNVQFRFFCFDRDRYKREILEL